MYICQGFLFVFINFIYNYMIFLIGYMCAGKTTSAKLLAELLRSPFYDLDDIIEKKYEISINDIFFGH